MERKYNPKPRQAVALYNHLKDYNPKIGVELGVFWGETYFYLLNKFPKLNLIGIDLWKQVDWGDTTDDGFRTYEQFPLEQYYLDVECNCGQYGHRAKIYRMDTVEASHLFSENTFDFVFIDGDHTYEGVRRDILAWKNKVKKGGWIMGHDIHMAGVKRAVNESFSSYLELDNFVWAVQK